MHTAARWFTVRKLWEAWSDVIVAKRQVSNHSAIIMDWTS